MLKIKESYNPKTILPLSLVDIRAGLILIPIKHLLFGFKGLKRSILYILQKMKSFVTKSVHIFYPKWGEGIDWTNFEFSSNSPSGGGCDQVPSAQVTMWQSANWPIAQSPKVNPRVVTCTHPRSGGACKGNSVEKRFKNGIGLDSVCYRS